MLDHPIFPRCPAQHPDRLQLFSLPTPNGVQVGIMLEQTGSTVAWLVGRCSAACE